MSTIIRLFGTFTHALDAQRRVSLPSAWKKQLNGVELLLARKKGGYLQLDLAEDFDQYMQSIQGPNAFLDDAFHKNKALYLSETQDCSTDKQGRLSLPADFLAHAGITGELLMVGNYRNIQIWSPERWNAAKAESGDSAVEELQKRAQTTTAESALETIGKFINKDGAK